MLVLVSVGVALGLNVGNAVLPASSAVRVSAPSMALETKFVYSPPKGPLSMNFAANMGDCAQIPVYAEESGKKYKSRIVPATPSSKYSSFLYDPPTPLDRTTPVPK